MTMDMTLDYRLNQHSLHYARLAECNELNQLLITGLQQYIDDQDTRKTHEFFGRYENIYIDAEKIPAIRQVLRTVTEIAAEILQQPAEELKAGLWFNLMNPGDRTTLHRHDDDDELLSAVYYVKVPKNSGELMLGTPPMHCRVTPEEGLFVFFPPDMPHEVTENLSQHSRISLGINIGPQQRDD